MLIESLPMHWVRRRIHRCFGLHCLMRFTRCRSTLGVAVAAAEGCLLVATLLLLEYLALHGRFLLLLGVHLKKAGKGVIHLAIPE